MYMCINDTYILKNQELYNSEGNASAVHSELSVLIFVSPLTKLQPLCSRGQILRQQLLRITSSILCLCIYDFYICLSPILLLIYITFIQFCAYTYLSPLCFSPMLRIWCYKCVKKDSWGNYPGDGDIFPIIF